MSLESPTGLSVAVHIDGRSLPVFSPKHTTEPLGTEKSEGWICSEVDKVSRRTLGCDFLFRVEVLIQRWHRPDILHPAGFDELEDTRFWLQGFAARCHGGWSDYGEESSAGNILRGGCYDWASKGRGRGLAIQIREAGESRAINLDLSGPN
jgi:hypothetical protein